MTPSLLSVYLRFLRSPDLTTPFAPPPIRQIIRQGLRLYCLHLIILLGVGLLIGQVVEQDDSLFPQLFQDTSVVSLFLFAVVVAPLLEETVFRLPLRGTRLNLGLSLALMVGLNAANGGLSIWTIALLSCGLLLLSSKLLQWRHPMSLPQAIAGVYGRFPHFIFYGLTLLFGAIHITNYEEQVWHWLPLLVLPQVLIGLWLGFVRVQYGFGWAILAHAFHNGCLLLPILSLQLFGSTQLVFTDAPPDFTTLPTEDVLLFFGVALYMLGGLLMCAMQSWRLLRDWQKKRPADHS